MLQNSYFISISGLNIRIDSDLDIRENSAFSEFCIHQSENLISFFPDWIVQVCSNSELKLEKGKLISDNYEYSCYYISDQRYSFEFKDLKNQNNIYAVSIIDEAQKKTELSYIPTASCYFSELSNCFFHTCWEKVMSIYGRLIFHSACVRTTMGGILFSGPSGIGKSTQADLWTLYENAELINGDRTILYADNDGRWLASGSPYAGSSKCYKNEQCEVKAIVMLRQSANCNIRRLKPAESFHKIFQQCTVYNWDEAFVNTVCDLVENICMQIPVYEYSCNISKTAVQVLKEELEGC